jgi:threonine/homoserine/homoserine lactone efflux protein
MLILSETAKRGLEGGLRVMLGANLTLLGILVVLALGFSSLTPAPGAIRTLQVVGGLFLLWIGGVELRSVLAEARSPLDGGPPPVAVGRPAAGRGGWLGDPQSGRVVFATTASGLMAKVTADDGTASALAAALAVAVGVSCSDLTFTILGSRGRRLVGEGGLRWIRTGLAALLVVLGAAFVVQGIGG